MTEVAVLLAVYNGESFIKQQLDSIINQTYDGWQLFIRDDGSNDRTLEIVESYVADYKGKIHLIKDNRKNLGSCNNFFTILNNVEAKYYLFSDQDDVWYENKIELTLKKIKELEGNYSNNIPILLHTDLEVVDDNLNLLAYSFWKYQKMNVKDGKSFNKLLLENIVTGCTMIFNNSLKSKLNKLPDNVFVHDWWIALVCSAFGVIEEIDITTVKYRQHNYNVAGAKKTDFKHFLKRLTKLDDVKQGLINSVEQAKVFLEIYHDQLDERTLKMLKEFSNLFENNWIIRRKILFKYKIYKSNFNRNIGLFLIA